MNTPGSLPVGGKDHRIPQSRHIRLIERFLLSEGEERLDYTVSITDDETFTKPLLLSRYWVWKPEMRVNRFDCKE